MKYVRIVQKNILESLILSESTIQTHFNDCIEISMSAVFYCMGHNS